MIIAKARWLAEKMIGPDEPGPRLGSIELEDIQEIALSVVGLFLIARGINGIPSSISYELQTASFNEVPVAVGSLVAGLIGPVLQLLFGIALFFGARTTSQWVKRVRALAEPRLRR